MPTRFQLHGSNIRPFNRCTVELSGTGCSTRSTDGPAGARLLPDEVALFRVSVVPLRTASSDAQHNRLPQEVLSLAPREREIATLVYCASALTAKAVCARLPEPISNGAVRSMLNRLVAKCILARRRTSTGKQYVYVPAITNFVSLENAVKRIAGDYFDGSVDRALETMRLILTDLSRDGAQSEQRRSS